MRVWKNIVLFGLLAIIPMWLFKRREKQPNYPACYCYPEFDSDFWGSIDSEVDCTCGEDRGEFNCKHHDYGCLVVKAYKKWMSNR